MDPDTYHCRLYDDKIEIETVIRPKEVTESANSEVTDNESEVSGSSEIQPIMSVFSFKEDMLDFAENHDSLLLVVARRQFYCFPKRCMTEEQQNIVRNHLLENTGSAF